MTRDDPVLPWQVLARDGGGPDRFAVRFTSVPEEPRGRRQARRG